MFEITVNLIEQLQGTARLYCEKSTAQRVYTVCTRINYKTAPSISSNNYLHHGIRGTRVGWVAQSV
jgi:hypothetical protein